LQLEYNLTERDAERELLPMARAFNIGVTAWTPLASGLLSGKYSKDASAAPRRLDDPVMSRFAPRTERNMAITEEVSKIAAEIGSTPAQVALNWLRHRGVIPIFGARTVEQVKENLGCFEYELTESHIHRLDEVSKIKLGFPHDFLASGIVRKFTYGGMYNLIENPPK
jgi:aryl-alcohol dehydrogenase-like predicted oxidoreductase